MLAQLAADEACQVEAMTSTHVLPVLPSSRTGFHECARCYALATTRCSRCKSVRYCSGKCQIIHWRQGHKHECQQWHDSSLNVSAGLSHKDTVRHKPFIDNIKSSFLGIGIEEPMHCSLHNDIDDPSFITTDTSQDSETGRKTSDKWVLNKSKGAKSNNDDIATHACNQDYSHGASAQASLTNNLTENSPEDTTIGHKLASGNLTASSGQVHLNQEINSSSNARNVTVQHNKSAGIPQDNVSSNNHLQGLNKKPSIEGRMAGSKKTSKVLKWNLVGLINDNNKNKVCRILFPYEDLVKFFQCEEEGIYPTGLLNCGNSCYANAVLQCLTGTKPLMVYLLQRLHSRTCCVKGRCLMCELEQHVTMLREGGGPLSPSRILSNMRNIGCRMGGGNQEDAHEFLRLLVMSMQSVCLEGLGGKKEVDPRLHETTLVQQIFGGRLKSKTGKYGKINKCVTFPDLLDMIPFVTGPADNPPLYLLYAVVVHLDTFNASFSGHYISYVKDLAGTWFRIDDSEVQAVPLSQVMSEGAYMLFYSRSFPRPPQAYIEKMLSRPPTCTSKSQN